MDDEKAHSMWTTLFPTICLLSLISSVSGVLCPNGCKCENEILRANCSGAGIEVVPIQLNPELHVMDLSYNKITLLHYTFTFYEKLYILDLSRNRVKNIGNGNFKTQKVLKFLNLSSNLIESLSKDTFEGLFELTELDLTNNQLKSIGANVFKDLNNLTILRMNKNELDYFQEGTFKFTTKLQALYIDDNSFIELPAELSELTQLKILSMSRNLIESIEDEKVPNLHELQTLILVENLIEEIQPKGFNNMPTIDHLDLSDNNLTILPTTQLSKLPKLVNLKLNGNTFVNIPPVAFRGLFHLKYLMLNRLETLESIDSRAFVDNINLEKISMDYNYKTKVLPTRLFHGNPKLKYISIRYNAIKFLVATHFPLDQLEELKVGGNPLDCNCSMGWLWKIFQENQIQRPSNRSLNLLKLDINDVICNTPEELHDKKLISASQRQMDCSMSLLAIISVSVTVIFILSIIIGVVFVMPRKKSNNSIDKNLPKILKTSYNNAPPLPPPRKSLTNQHENSHAERYIMSPILLQNRSMPVWDPYSQHLCNGTSNIYEQLNDHDHHPHHPRHHHHHHEQQQQHHHHNNRDRPHIVYV